MARLAVMALLLAGCGSIFGLDTVDPRPDAIAPGPWTQVASGDAHSCALAMDGSLWCWGTNGVGQLGLGVDIKDVERPMRVGDATWLQVSTHALTTCGIQTDHTLWCWGSNITGNVGDSTTVDRPVPVQIAGTWNAVAAGRVHTCAIRDTGLAACWGAGSSGQIGNGAYGGVTMPADVMSTVTWLAIDTGDTHTCAIAADHRVWCWGGSANGETGTGSFGSTNVPKLVGDFPFDAIATGKQHACGIRSDRVMLCWGLNSSGQLGDTAVQFSLNPSPVLDTRNDWRTVGAGSLHTCATRTDGSLWCWGNNTGGQTGEGANVAYGPIPQQVAGGAPSWESVAGGDRSTCAVGADHNLWCFGVDGSGTSVSIHEPTQVAGTWQQVAASNNSTCGIAGDGSLACWGANSQGQVGDGTRVARGAPVTIAPPSWRQVAIGDGVCALDSGGLLSCWGYNVYGLGDGSLSRLVPTLISTKTWSAFSVGAFALGIEAGTGSLYCWGANYYGQCGFGDANTASTPRQVGSLTWSAVAAARTHGCGVNSSGLACWGINSYGEVGDGTMMQRQQPVQLTVPAGIASATPTLGVSMVSCAIASGQLWCWGYNYYGQTGSPSAVGVYYEPTPRLVSGTWKSVSIGGTHVCGISTTGALYCWGANDRGQLGDGTVLNHIAPAAVGTATDWTQVSAGSQYTCGVRDDETLWCWGGNDYGQLGLGVTPPNGTPRLILP